MEVEVAELSLESLDALEVEAAALFIVDEERPLQGLAGLCDWRLYGALSRTLTDGWYAGRLGETLLVPAQVGSRPLRIFAFGLGSLAAQRQTQAIDKALPRAFQALRKAGVASCCLSVPWPGVELEDALERWAVYSGLGPPQQLLLGDTRKIQRWVQGASARFPELGLPGDRHHSAPPPKAVGEAGAPLLRGRNGNGTIQRP